MTTPKSVKYARAVLFGMKAGLILVVSLIGFLLGHWGGLILALIIVLSYVFVASATGGRYPLDLHQGKVFDGDLDPDVAKVTRELAEMLGIDPPAVYMLDIPQPQMCVCANGYGKSVRGRIGLTKALIQEADSGKLRVLLTLAVARIACGKATVLSSVAPFVGLFYQFAQSDAVNSLPKPESRDPITELSPFGGFLIQLWSPVAGLIMSTTGVANLVRDGDCAAFMLGQYSYKPEYVDSALRWLTAQQFARALDPIAVFNPAETPLYLASPFEMDMTRNIETGVQPAPWRAHLANVTLLMPNIDTRIDAIRAKA